MSDDKRMNISDEAVEAARARRQACERAVSNAVDRGDMKAAELRTAEYLAAGAEEDRLERELIDGYPYRHAGAGGMSERIEGIWTMTESEFNAELAKAWDEGHEAGFWNGRLSQLTVPYDAPEPEIGVEHSKSHNPYRE